MKKLTRLFSVVLVLALISALVPVPAAAAARQAPTMYINWADNGSYDVMAIDWYCQQDALNKYWAVHNWYGGYAGFQNRSGSHVLLLSLWNLDDGTQPTIEYVKGGESGNFGGEGEGKHIYTNYNWQVGKWYTMLVQAWSANGKTYYGQWVREGTGAWVKTAVLSYPVSGRTFEQDSVFQEDYGLNNYSCSCRVRNAYGRFAGTNVWDSWDTGTVTNAYFPKTNGFDPEWNVTGDSDWGVGSSGDYMWIQSGGGDLTGSGKTLPADCPIKQAALPSYSDWAQSAAVSYNTASIVYSANGGTGAPAGRKVPKDKNGVAQYTLSTVVPVREGYTFLGWRLENNSGYDIDKPGQSITIQLDAGTDSTVTYYAQWKAGSTAPSSKYYNGMFSDVHAKDWFAGGVETAYNLGLMYGVSSTRFNPGGSVTIAQAVAMSARIHRMYSNKGVDDLVPGSPWYAAYVDYALKNGIISAGQYPDYNKPATRAQFAMILAASLPKEQFGAKSTVENGAIPDVTGSESYGPAVYMLYRAGVLAGSDSRGTFKPASSITRAESAAIVSRIKNGSLRLSAEFFAGEAPGTSASAASFSNMHANWCSSGGFAGYSGNHILFLLANIDAARTSGVSSIGFECWNSSGKMIMSRSGANNGIAALPARLHLPVCRLDDSGDIVGADGQALTDMQYGQTYYFRAYVTLADGGSYQSDTVSFVFSPPGM